MKKKRALPNASDRDSEKSDRSDKSDKIGIKLGTSLDANYRLEESYRLGESSEREVKAEQIKLDI